MGYAEMKQQGHGIHLRQFARTFIVEDEKSHNRIVFVSVDAGMMGHGIKRNVSFCYLDSTTENLINHYI